MAMKRPIAIDLGTTNSVVTLPEARTGRGYLVVRQCPGCSVITDRFARPFVPSVLAEDPSGKPVVGYPAKARAGQTPAPVMFAKRSMGEDRAFAMDKLGVLRPEEVSSHVLRHLKTMAEDVLGEKVTEAVITVPAYFTLRAKQMTEKAAELAGLKVAQIAQEPVAAALMYCAMDPRDPLRILTYDLGGGTFDVAILEKRDGVITTDSILSFDGDRLLGGYNFDRTLAFWIMDQLIAQGYDLHLDPESPADAPAFAKLMVIAEQAKIRLSSVEVHVIDEPNTGIIDHTGNPVAIIGLEVSRAQFEAMITTEIEYTIQICRRAIAQACQTLTEKSKSRTPVRPEDILPDLVVVMVGGSSRIPRISRRMEEEFHKTPLLVEPDLAVALGAALLAAGLGGVQGCFKLPNIPAQTDMNPISISGQLVPSEGLADVAECSVRLTAADGSYDRTRTTSTEGGFTFDRVPLMVENTTSFTLSARTKDGRIVGSHQFTVRHTTSQPINPGIGGSRPVTNVLAKPINIRLVEGFFEAAPARTPLPFETVVPAKRVSSSKEIRIPILEDRTVQGEIVMQDIPDTLPVGSEVQITLSISSGYLIRGQAYVPALARTQPVEIQLQPRVIRPVTDLRREFELLSEKAEEVLHAAGPAVAFERGQGLQDSLDHARQMLQAGDRNADPARIQDCLDEIQDTLHRIEGQNWKPVPPREDFERKALEVNKSIARLIKQEPDAARDGYEDELTSIRKEAEQALMTCNDAAWRQSYSQLVQLGDAVEARCESKGGETAPDPALMAIQCAQNMTKLREIARSRGLLSADLEKEFQAAAQGLKAIDVQASDALARIRDWYFSRYVPLEEAVTGTRPDPDKKAFLSLDKEKMQTARKPPGLS